MLTRYNYLCQLAHDDIFAFIGKIMNMVESEKGKELAEQYYNEAICSETKTESIRIAEKYIFIG